MNIINSFNTLRTATACACIALAASASAATVDFGEIEAGKTYSFSKGDELKGTYTATQLDSASQRGTDCLSLFIG